MPFEGTELGEIAKEMGKVPVSDFSMSYHTENFVNLTNVPSKEVNRIRRQALMKFYLNPIRLFVLVRDFPNKRELGKLMVVFFRRLCLAGVMMVFCIPIIKGKTPASRACAFFLFVKTST